MNHSFFFSFLPGDYVKYLEIGTAHLILVESCSWRMEMPFCLLIGFSFTDLTSPRNLLWVTSDWNMVRSVLEILIMTVFKLPNLYDSLEDQSLYIAIFISCDLCRRSHSLAMGEKMGLSLE